FCEGDDGNTHTFGLVDVELMQNTCLRDMNGKKIYEGDIVRNVQWTYVPRTKIPDFDEFQREKTIISYEDDGEYISFYYEDGRDVVTLDRFRFWLENESFGWEGENLWEPKDCEVIGNIYENPELLETGT